MLVRVRPVANRTSEDVEEPVSEVTGRAVGREDKRLSGSTILATRANPLPGVAGASVNGETRVAVRRRPVYNGDRLAEEQRIGQGVRLVARRPNAIPETDRGNYVTVRRRPTTPELTTVPTTKAPAPTTTPAPTEPELIHAPSTNLTNDEYDDEYEYYDYEDESTTAAATTTSTTTTTTTTTTTKRPNSRPLANRRRFSSASPAASTTTSKPSTSPTSSTTRGASNRRGGASTSTTTTTRRPTTPAEEAGPPVEVRSDDDVDCFKRGVFIHPTECSKFVVCAPASRAAGQALKGRVLHCPANQIYLVDIGRCMKGDRTKCQKIN